jgi:hypothetical protein
MNKEFLKIFTELIDALDNVPYEYGSLPLDQELTLNDLITKARSVAQSVQTDVDNNTIIDALRYKWIKSQRNLELHTCRTYGTPWTNTETGETFYPSHYLAANGTGFNGIKKLDDLIDQAMELYPIKQQ